MAEKLKVATAKTEISKNEKIYNDIREECYVIHSLGVLLELDKNDGESEAIETLNRGNNVSHPISNMARIIQEKVCKVLKMVDGIEYGKQS